MFNIQVNLDATCNMYRFAILVVIIIVTSAHFFTDNIYAQQSSFLVTPYYENASITQGYNSNHEAYDFNLAYRAVLASAQGTINEAKWYNAECHHYRGDDRTMGLWCGYGLYVKLTHNNGYGTLYAHLSSIASTSGSVEAGQIIGTSGETGWSTGAHLHFEVRNSNGAKVDPFNPNLWKDGQWADPSRPLPEPVNGGEIIVDDNPDNNGGFSKGMGGPFNNPCTGSGCPYWYRATGSGLGAYGDDMYWTYDNNSTPDYWAKWQPSLPHSGLYEVYVHVPTWNGTTWQAPYTIVHTFGQTQASVDQLGLENRWVSIGAYQFDPGLGYIYLTDASREPNVIRQVGVDAVKFVRRGTTYQPDIKTSTGWTSNLQVRSNGGVARTRVTFFDSNGTLKGASTANISGHASQSFQAPAGATWAIADASQDISVIVRNKRYNELTIYNGIMASGAVSG